MKEEKWSNSGFNNKQTRAIIISRFEDGKWTEPKVSSDFNLSISCYAGALHYADSCFEGLKVFRGSDGKLRMFRPEENARRMADSAAFLDIPCPSPELFIRMCVMCAMENVDYIPPYGLNSSFYIRPLLIGSNPQLKLFPSECSTFVVMGTPVGTYSAEDRLTSINVTLCRDFDRVAPNGGGGHKLSSNYGPSFRYYKKAHQLGYGDILFLDAATHTFVEEFCLSNFFALKGNVFITPDSPGILPSITNKSLRTIAQDMGLKVEVRPVPCTELGEMEEVNNCGTAVVITPVYRIVDKPSLCSENITEEYIYAPPGKCGRISIEMYRHLRAIQDGDEADIHRWCLIL